MMFKSFKVYAQISRDKVTAINLDTEVQVVRQAEQPFSSTRQVVGSFNNANTTLQNALKDLDIQKTFSGLKMVIQQTEGTEGGLSDIEKRALRDIAEIAGANKVYLVEHERSLSLNDALEIIKQGK